MEPHEVLLQGSAETVDVTLLLMLGGDELILLLKGEMVLNF